MTYKTQSAAALALAENRTGVHVSRGGIVTSLDGSVTYGRVEKVGRVWVIAHHTVATCPRCGCTDRPGAHAAGCQDGQYRWGNIRNASGNRRNANGNTRNAGR